MSSHTQMLKRMPALTAVAALLALCTAACTDDVQDLYARVRAFFRFNNVIGIHQLNTAVNNPGQWCSITIRNNTYEFTSPSGQTTPADATALAVYGRPECIAGFIVGRPSVMDLNGQNELQAYDLVCPSCYEASAVQRSVAFDAKEPEHVVCPRCSRTYDLKNGGIVITGNAGAKLYRYHVTYSSTGSGLLLISN